MTIRHKYNALLVAVIAGLPAVAFLGWSSPTHAQYRVGGDGHANDANPQVGSGGYNGNSSPQRVNSNQLNNNIVNGNVSGLGYFHGNTREIDPNAVNVNTGTFNSDRLNAIAGASVPGSSGGVHTEAPIGTTPGITPYYSTNTFVGTPPPNFAVTPNGNALVPAPRLDPLKPTDFDTRVDSSGTLNSNPATGNLIIPGELDVVGGPADPSGNASIYSMSPLYGVRAMQTGNPDDTFYQNRFGTVRTTAANPAGQQTDQTQIQKMRDELNNNPVPADQPGQNNEGVKPAPGAIPLPETSVNGAVGSLAVPPAVPVDSSVKSGAVTGSLNTGEGMQNQLLIPPAKQSAQLKELERQFAKSQGKISDLEAAKRYNEELKAQSSDAGATGVKPVAPANPGTVTPFTPDHGALPTEKPTDTNPPKTGPKPILNNDSTSSAENKPLVITSLATGVPAKMLADQLKDAEDKMRQGKYAEAIASYEIAEQAVPNNPFVYLGRSFAELASSYYGKADMDLRRAVLADPAVLAGRYDLNGFLGQDRVSFVQKELTDISASEKGARPVVLLAFISHNLGDDTAAAKDLDEATTRGGYTDLVDKMRTAWAIKAPK